ncbi:MAG TPA: YbaK/EbsC family protein [Candidatus Aquabacterium excrementipullorum]|nr:YbaK/EbsC family protein [Candidatus Aquabacterium excrementipullorum]
MSLASVQAFFTQHAPDVAILQTAEPTATVIDAARVHGVEPAQIAKTLSLWLKDEVIVLVMGGDCRLDNRRFKEHFGAKAKMLNAEEVVHWTGHPVGGVCPFGLAHPLKVFADVSLRRFDVVLPAAGSIDSALRITPDRLAQLVQAEWVDVAQLPAELPQPSVAA